MYGLSPGHCLRQCRPLGPDKAAGTARPPPARGEGGKSRKSPGVLSPATQASWAGQGSGHSPKLRGAVVYDPSPGHFPLQRRPLGPDKAAGTARLGLPRGGKGFYVSSVIMLLGPPGPIPRRACCGRCIYDSRKYKKPLRAFIELWTILNEIFYTTFQNTADPGENIQIQLFNIIVVPFIDDGKACTNAGCQFVARDIAVMEDLL